MHTLAVLFLMLILGNPDYLSAREIMKLTEKDSSKTIELHVGDELEIVLPANPTTGYMWEGSSLNSSVLKLDKSDFISGDKALGSGGMEVIKLHAISDGKTKLTFKYHRPFEKNKPPLNTFEVDVIIKK